LDTEFIEFAREHFEYVYRQADGTS
jgi:hypothetical protein